MIELILGLTSLILGLVLLGALLAVGKRLASIDKNLDEHHKRLGYLAARDERQATAISELFDMNVAGIRARLRLEQRVTALDGKETE